MYSPMRLFLALALTLPAWMGCTSEAQLALSNHPIINGEIDESHTSVVALVALGSEFCSGTVIAPRAILTAGHCVAEPDIDPTAMQAFFGTVVGGEGAKVRVTQAKVHPKYYTAADGAPMYDVAVLTLAEDAPVPPMPWQRTTLDNPKGKTVTLVGYGVTDAQRQTGSGTRRTVDEVITSMDNDFIHYGGGVSGTCQGDSGGPMFLNDENGTPIIISVTSYGDQTCVQEGGNTRVDKYASFIAPLAPMPLALAVQQPLDGATVGSKFIIIVEATSPAGIAEVDLLIDGEPWQDPLTEAPYTFELTNMADGDHLLTIKAQATDGSTAQVEVDVFVATLPTGATCAQDADCQASLCAEAASGKGYCSQTCQTNADCPWNSSCNTVQDAKLCGRPGSAAGCAIGGSSSRAGGGMLALALVLLFLAVRRRRTWINRTTPIGLALTLLALASFLPACSGGTYAIDANFPTREGGPQRDASAAADAAAPDAGLPLGIGEACTTSVSIGPGTCAPGLICLTDRMTGGVTRNGYCTLECGNGLGCTDESVCVAVYESLSLCLKQCADDTGCRTSEKYHCMPLDGNQVCWSWIVPPGTDDGGACSSSDAGSLIPADGGVFQPSIQLEAPTGSLLEAGTQLAAKGSKLLATFTSYTNSYGGGGGKITVSASSDSGATFGTPVFVTDNVTTRKSDPVVAFDPSVNNYAYLAWVGYDRTAGTISNLHVFVARSDDGGLTWPAPTGFIRSATPLDTSVTNLTRPWITVGSGGEVYVVYGFTSANGATSIKIVRSTDNGDNWSAPLRIDEDARPGNVRSLPHVASNTAGDVFVAWLERGGDANGDVLNGVYEAHWHHGSTWDSFSANVKGSADEDLVVTNSLALAPSLDGAKVYLVYTAGAPELQRWNIRMTWSDGIDEPFTEHSTKINDDATCAIHYLPSAVVDSANRLHVTWYDNRFLVGALYYAWWDPLAATVSPAQFASDGTFEFSTDSHASSRLGNTSGLAQDGANIYATWSDARGAANTSHIRFAWGAVP